MNDDVFTTSEEDFPLPVPQQGGNQSGGRKVFVKIKEDFSFLSFGAFNAQSPQIRLDLFPVFFNQNYFTSIGDDVT